MTKEKTKKKRDVEGSFPTFNGSDVPGWPRSWPPRPEAYFAAPYDWSHAWPSHVRGDPSFPGEFGGFPRTGYPYPGNMQPGLMPPSATLTALANSPTRASPHSSNIHSDSAKSQSEGSSFSATVDTTQDANEEGGSAQKHKRKRRNADKESRSKQICDIDAIKNGTFDGAAKNGTKDPKGKQSAVDESTAKNKRYGFEEIKDLVKLRTDLQAKFETMSTHLELWLSIGDKMCEKGHPKRHWESYRDKWDIELRRYQKELKNLLAQSGLGENKELEHPEQLVFTDEVLQEIHKRLNMRPKAALRSRFQSGMGGARGCLGDDNAREVAGKRMKKTANNQLLVDSIVEKVVDKIGNFDDTASAQGFKEVLEAVVNLTNVLCAEVQPQQAYAELEIDDKVFTWLKSIGKEQYASYFAAAHVDWANLLLLDKDDLMEMKIPIGPRKLILSELDKLRPAPAVHNQGQTAIPEPEAEPEPEQEAEAV